MSSRNSELLGGDACDNLVQRGSVNDDQHGPQERALKYATVKLKLSRKRPINRNVLAAIRQI